MKRQWVVGLTFFALGLAGVSILAAGGCSRPARKAADSTKDGKEPENPQSHLQDVSSRFSKGSSAAFEDQVGLVQSRNAIGDLNRYLKALKDGQPSFKLAKDRRERLQKRFGLYDDDQGRSELAEIESPAFTLLDAYYLDFCFQMAGVVRSLDVKGLPVLERARVGFDWVNRQVILNERIRAVEFGRVPDPLLPPQFALQLGRGMALEKAMIFLSLLQQMEIEGCMIAFPGLDKDQMQYWLPGVLVPKGEQDRRGKPIPPGVYLFDTRLGIPFPAALGQGIARLDEVMADLETARKQFRSEFRAKIVPSGITRAEVHLACTLSALSPRMSFLQKKLTGTAPVSLAVDPDASTKRFQSVTKAPVGIWNRRDDPNTPTRVLRVFLPKDQGGLDNDKRMEAYTKGQLIPWFAIRHGYPADLSPTLYTQLEKSHIAEQFLTYALGPRNLLVRGRVSQAVKPLSAFQEVLGRGRATFIEETRTPDLKGELEQQIKELCFSLQGADEKLAEARQEAQAEPQNPAAKLNLKKANDLVRDLWKNNQKLLEIIFYQAIAQPLGKETNFLICLCKQETAQRYQTRLERLQSGTKSPPGEMVKGQKEARVAWTNAIDWWHTFLNEYGVTPQTTPNRLQELNRFRQNPNLNRNQAEIAMGVYESTILDLSRTVSSRRLLALALENAGRKEEAVQVLENQARDLDTWQKDNTLKALSQFAEEQRIMNSYSRPDNLGWLEITIAMELERMKKK